MTLSAFFKNCWLGIFLTSVLASLAGTFIYDHWSSGPQVAVLQDSRTSPHSPVRGGTDPPGEIASITPQHLNEAGTTRISMSRDEIDEKLRDLPTFQGDEAARLYKGVHIQWAGEVRGMYRGQKDRIVVSLTCRNSVVVMSDTFAVVPYAPEVILLREGVKVKVVGTISRIEPGRNGPVWLDPAEIPGPR